MTRDKLSASVVLYSLCFMPCGGQVLTSDASTKKETLTSIYPYIVIHFCLSLHHKDHKDAHTSSKKSKYLSAIKAWVEQSGIPE